MKGLRTKKVNTIKEGTLIVAVDIGMVSNHGCCTTADGRKEWWLRYAGNSPGALREW